MSNQTEVKSNHCALYSISMKMEVKSLLFIIFNLVSCYLAENGDVTFKNVKVSLSGSCYLSNYEEPNLTISRSNNLGELLNNYPLGKCVEIANQSIPVIYTAAVSNIHDVVSLDINNCGIGELQPGAFQNSSITNIYIEDNKELETIKRGVFNQGSGSEVLFLRRNGIRYIEKGAFENLRSSLLNLVDNLLEEVPLGVFNNISVVSLDLRRNKIKKIHSGAFSNNPLLFSLDLEDNLIVDIAPGAFGNNPSLEQLYLLKNYLTQINRGILGSGLRNPIELTFDYNYITTIEQGAFEGYNFHVLSVSHNKLEEVKNGTFNGSNIEELLLFNNTIKNVEEGAFNIGTLTTVDLGRNNLTIVKRGTFVHHNISKINLYNNDIEEIETGAFNSNLSGVFLQDAKLDDGSKTYIRSLPNVYTNSDDFRVSRFYIH